MVPLSYYSSRLIEKVLLSLQSCIIAVHCVNKCYNILSSRGFAVVRGVVFAVIMAVCGFAAQAQQGIVKVDVPDTVCYGDTVEVTFGFDESYSVMFQYEEVTLGQDDKIFLPDGEPCGDMGCAYISSVTFDQFPDTATVFSVQAIRYLRINIEHSYIADLYINLECPNGQSANVLRFGGTANSQCNAEIPDSGRVWLQGENISLGSYFGQPIYFQGTHSGCDSTLPINAAGVGWNYCWSSNTVSNYRYASGDGILYRMGHSHDDRTVDSSDVENYSNFYHPDQSFSSLVGCPLNGSWSVKVIDGYMRDNGYIFSWSLSLDANLVAFTPCPVDSFAIFGDGATRVGDFAYRLAMPAAFDHDTTLDYTFRTYDICGGIYDTNVSITFLAPKHTWEEMSVVENDLPVTFNEMEFNDTVTDFVFPAYEGVYGCDSLVHFTLNVWRNYNETFDTVVCSYDLPIMWHDTLLYRSENITCHNQTSHGADSITTLVLTVIPADTVETYASLCKGVTYTWIDGVTYDDDSIQPVVVFHTDGLCDSIVRLNISYNRDSYKAFVRASPNPVTDVNTEVTLTDVSSSTSRKWFLEDRVDTARSCRFSFVYPRDSMEVLFTGRDFYGCTDTATVVVYSNVYVYWIPNAFTPDESTNNRFSVFSRHIKSGTVHIFDRKGLHITDFDALTGEWDGTKNGRPCPQGAYVWKLTYTTDFTPEVQQNDIGTVTILR